MRKYINLNTTRSKYKRDKQAEEIFLNHGHNTHVMELQGDLGFATCEIFMRRISPACETLIISLQKCTGIDDAAVSLLLELHQEFIAHGKTLFITNYYRLKTLDSQIVTENPCFQFEQLEDALFSCENTLLNGNNYSWQDYPVPLRNQQLLWKLEDTELHELSKHLVRKTFKKGELIVEKGRKAKHIYFLETGEVDIMGINDENRQFIISVLSSGNSFGEMALLENTVRSANVVAKTDAACLLIPFALLDLNPILAGVKSKILTNIAVSLSGRLRIANQEIASFV